MTLLNLLYLTLLLLVFSCGQKQKEVSPQKRQLTEAVYASGTLVPEKEYKVTSATEGYLTESFIQEGTQIKKGQQLFFIRSATKEASLTTAALMAKRTEALTASSSPLIKGLYSNLAAANLRVKNDSLQYIRYKNLFEQDAIARSSFEKWQHLYLTAQQDRTAIIEQIKAQQLSLNLQRQGAVNGVTLSLAEKNNGHLKSFTDGTVYEVYKQVGDHITPHEPIALLGSGKIIARLSVDEDDFGKLQPGQKVLLKTDAFPDKVLQARISKIYPLLNKADQTFRVDAELSDALPQTLYGLNIEANIVTEENKPVLAIPKEALLKGDSVLTKENNSLKKIKISKGVEDKEWVEVKSGLTANHLIVIQ
ncbi:MAG TPA: efflux RND transporter periplasmic adaptor subunit [Flavisolibacter sp.]|jgi:multidrug efflux pump subunit AcrA (membrane-fusion protein)|nr:efflux RND transporter periplasmic adaptor subunit [Flavisolibacter sp.]